MSSTNDLRDAQKSQLALINGLPLRYPLSAVREYRQRHPQVLSRSIPLVSRSERDKDALGFRLVYLATGLLIVSSNNLLLESLLFFQYSIRHDSTLSLLHNYSFYSFFPHLFMS
jgi:hypothetical protein